MTHHEALEESPCQGEITKGNTFFSQDFSWRVGTCQVCGEQVAMLRGFAHRFNYRMVTDIPAAFKRAFEKEGTA